jgi:hypothetical protein
VRQVPDSRGERAPLLDEPKLSGSTYLVDAVTLSRLLSAFTSTRDARLMRSCALRHD